MRFILFTFDNFADTISLYRLLTRLTSFGASPVLNKGEYRERNWLSMKSDERRPRFPVNLSSELQPDITGNLKRAPPRKHESNECVNRPDVIFLKQMQVAERSARERENVL